VSVFLDYLVGSRIKRTVVCLNRFKWIESVPSHSNVSIRLNINYVT